MPKHRIIAGATVAALVAATVALTNASQAASPGHGSISESSPSVTWDGSIPFGRAGIDETGCLGPLDPQCDHFEVTLDAPAVGGYSLDISVTPDDGVTDLDIHVFDADGRRIGAGDAGVSNGGEERAVVVDPPSGRYTISVQSWSTLASMTYGGSATLSDTDDPTSFFSLFDGTRIDATTQDCLQAAPVVLDQHGLTDDGAEISLDVLLLLDGITPARAKTIADKAKESYAELGIDFNVTGYDTTFSAASTGTVTDFNGGTRSEISADLLFQATKAHVGGVPPEGSDLVYTMTDKELYKFDAVDGSKDHGLLGQADCIGGIRWDNNAFAIGEAWADQLGRGVLGVDAGVSQNNGSVIVLAHEIGHLMGAHHHYGECVTGQRPHDSNERVDPRHPCTLMFPSAGPNNLPFSGLNGLVVRGHADGWARP